MKQKRVVQELKARLASSKARVVSIRLPENDIEIYIKSLLHQALRRSR